MPESQRKRPSVLTASQRDNSEEKGPSARRRGPFSRMQPLVAKISKPDRLRFGRGAAKMSPRKEADDMNLSEKILALRTQLGLSQGELAEKLEVSRQSVSKWETAQSVPELDKLIRLADLFGVSVDELVREGEPPRPEAETGGAEPEPKLVYVERKGLRPAQILGIVLTVVGMVMMLAMLFNASTGCFHRGGPVRPHRPAGLAKAEGPNGSEAGSAGIDEIPTSRVVFCPFAK